MWYHKKTKKEEAIHGYKFIDKYQIWYKYGSSLTYTEIESIKECLKVIKKLEKQNETIVKIELVQYRQAYHLEKEVNVSS